ncbi:MAG: hypothetical protein PHC34_08065 [Candidatus Gastranaerophilales bacterium]|nr:hypothetical protein [Candidatus Gastranaerophilales bacterium]
MTMINTKTSNNINFQGIPGKRFLKTVDFEDKFTSTKATMVLYSGCILSRLVNSRDKYEFKETLARDSMGWASLFFLAAIFEKTVGLAIEKISGKADSKDVNLFLKNEKETKNLPSFLQAIKFWDKKFAVRSFNDIETLQDETLKKSLKAKKTALYLLSIAFSIGVIGIFIPWMNTVTTKKDKKREIEALKSQKQQSAKIKSKPVLMQEFLNNAKNKKSV